MFEPASAQAVATAILAQTGPIVSYETWLAALASSACIGFTSLVPWLFNMTFFEQSPSKQTGGKPQNNDDYRMKFLLSFAVGAILGDIFFHLIPESVQSHITELNDLPEAAHRKVGVSIIAGIFMFIIVEMLLEKWSHSMSTEQVNQKETDDSKAADDNLSIKDTSAIEEKCEFITKADEQNEQDLKLTIGALINYFEENDKLENNNNLIKNLNFHLNNNNIHQKDAILNRRKPISSDTIKLTKSQQQSKCPADERKLSTINNQYDDGTTFAAEKAVNAGMELSADKQEDDCFAKSVEPVQPKCPPEERSVEVAGYLSLIANGFDNFTHGLAIGASFLVGHKVGLLTTFVIFIHEIPHEICDYAILVNSGFSRWDAAKAQSSVSLFGILGTATALYVKSIETLTAKTCWILPFSAGGFLYIALVNLLPEILDQRTSFRNSNGQIACVTLGIAFMALVGVI